MDRAHGRVHIGGSEIRLLHLGDFFSLSARDLADLVRVRTGRTLGDLRGLLDQNRSRGRLHHEGEALVGVGGDHNRNRKTCFHLLRLGVKGLAEFHDVQTALAESRTNGGRGIGFACRNLQLNKADDFLCHF